MKEALSNHEQNYHLDNFDEPLRFSLNNFNELIPSRNRSMGSRALGADDKLPYTEEELDARRALQESMELRD